MSESFLAAFVARSDAIGISVMLILLAMSVACWFQLLLKLWEGHGERMRSDAFVASFAGMTNLAALERWLAGSQLACAPARVTAAALTALAQWQENQQLLATGRRLLAIEDGADFVLRAVQGVSAEEGARRDAGLTVLATVGSAAPFVGLFGTVWGIYHALIAIGQGGQATLDRVAGPVGEALVMTACGLAVAIPAVLFYNWLVRRNAARELALDTFAQRLFVFLAIEAQVDPQAARSAYQRLSVAGAR